MNKVLAISLLICFGTSPSLAQEEYNGLILEDENFDTVPLSPVLPERGNLPLLVDLKPYCPTPGDQGQQPSCVAWAIANALTLTRAVKANEKSPQRKQEMSHSVAYIYNQIKHQGDCLRGATFSAGLHLLKTKGDCLAKNLAYDHTQCHELPKRIHHQQAARYRIANYFKLFDKTSTRDDKISAILSALANNQAVILGLKVPFGLRKRVPRNAEEWKPETHHAMLAVGYNDLTETITLMNSYGAQWGNQGFCEIDYQSLGLNVVYAYVIEIGQGFGRAMAR
ncbi:MAG: C1 family peptidase [Saprospiraceae bacterium]|nr:C1 family peptidase [Saprospiraceae bacterium]